MSIVRFIRPIIVRVGTRQRSRCHPALLAAALLLFPRADVFAESAADPRDARIEHLETVVELLAGQLQSLTGEIEALKQTRGEDHAWWAGQRTVVTELTERVDQLDGASPANTATWPDKLSLGGYGEMHANFGESEAADLFDLHRIVLALGYDFNDWIKLNSEIEIEHAFVSKGAGGELLVEQAHLDFLLSDAANVRFGRVLTPLGIVNQKHEPPSFNGVERPSFAKYIIPSTWSSDGVGLFGSLAPSTTYQAYIVAGLDGSGFSAKDGIRGGRIKERQSLHEPAFTGRLDWYPFAERPVGMGQALRLGASTYHGGLDNGNKGENPDVNGDIHIYSADFEYNIADLDFRGAVADLRIQDARGLDPGVASGIFGWYLEGAWHFLPESCKQGKLASADAVAFVRFDDFDTQYDMPTGMTADPAGDRTEWTFGVGLHLLPNFVVKADVQLRDDGTSDDLETLTNLGVGWQF